MLWLMMFIPRRSCLESPPGIAKNDNLLCSTYMTLNLRPTEKQNNTTQYITEQCLKALGTAIIEIISSWHLLQIICFHFFSLKNSLCSALKVLFMDLSIHPSPQAVGWNVNSARKIGFTVSAYFQCSEIFWFYNTSLLVRLLYPANL